MTMPLSMNFTEMQRASTAMLGLADEVETLAKTHAASLAGVLGEYQGDASSFHRQAEEIGNACVTKIRNVTGDMGMKIGASGRMTADIETTNAEMFRSNRFGGLA